MIKAAGAAAAMYQATSPPLPPIADEGDLRCSHGKSADEDCAPTKSHFHRKQEQTGFALKQLQTNKDEKSLQCHFR